MPPDLRNPGIIPLNFTKSINLAVSERGINAMRLAGHPTLLETVMDGTIPMRGRMVHGKGPTGALYEHSQDYDVKGRVRPMCPHPRSCRLSHPCLAASRVQQATADPSSAGHLRH